MNTLAIALRNLARNRRRSATTLAAIIVGAVAVLLFGGYARNIRFGMETDFIRSIGHLQIQHKDYFLYGTGNPAAYGIADYRHVIEVVRHDPVLAPMLTVVTPTLQLGGIAGNFAAGVSRTVFATGVDVAGQNALQQWNDYGFGGKANPIALTDTASDAAVVGVGVARVLQLCGALRVRGCATPAAGEDRQGAAIAAHRGAAMPADLRALSQVDAAASGPAEMAVGAARRGDRGGAGSGSRDPAMAARRARRAPRIDLLAATARGAPNVATLSVVKAVDEGTKDADDMFVEMHLGQAQRLVYGGDPPQVTAIIIQLRHTAQIPAARARLEHLLATTLAGDALEIHDFETLQPYYGQVVGFFAAIFGFMAVLIGVIVLFTVSNTMSMAVVERTAEIGTLRAIGLRRAGIRRIFLCEGLMLGLAGSVLGVLAALAIAALVNHSGITWAPPGRVDRVPLHVRLWGDPASMIGIMLALTLVAVISSWIPSRRGARTNIVAALRHA